MFLEGYLSMFGRSLLSGESEIKLKNIVNINNDSFMVSSCWTPDNGFETMVFASDYQAETSDVAEIDFDLIDFEGEYEEHHDSEEAMVDRHNFICKNLKLILSE